MTQNICTKIGKNDIITLHRGDDLIIPIYVNKGDGLRKERFDWKADYAFSSALYFGVMEPNAPWEESLIRKKYTFEDADENGDIIIRVKSIETEFLVPGTYYYEIKVLFVNPYSNDADEKCLETIVPRTKFTIVE